MSVYHAKRLPFLWAYLNLGPTIEVGRMTDWRKPEGSMGAENQANASAFVHVISRYFTFVPTMFPFPSLPCAVSLRWRNPLRNYTAAKA